MVIFKDGNVPSSRGDTDYNGISKRRNNGEPPRRGVRRANEVALHEFYDKASAEDVVEYLNEQIKEYDNVSIADYYNKINDPNIVAEFTEEKFGWTDYIQFDRVKQRTNGKWIIDFPRPQPLRDYIH